MNLKNLLDPLSKNMHLVILGIYAYVLLYHVKDSDYVSMVLLTAATCMAICYLKKNNELPKRLPLMEGASTCKKNDLQKGILIEGADCTPEGFKNSGKEGYDNALSPKVNAGQNIVRSLPASMGPFDGLCLQTGNKEYWMKSPDNTALIPNDALFSYLSSQGPTKPVFTDNSALYGPSVDGHPESDKKLFMLANNRTSPNCCPSTFSTSTGCVCTTKNQRDFVASRGGATLADNKKADLQDI